MMDSLILTFDRAARTLSGAAQGRRANPSEVVSSRKSNTGVEHGDATSAKSTTTSDDTALTDDERQLSIALMRVNHAGEVAAQALYQGQALFCRDPAVRARLNHAADEELDHLVWTRERVKQLGGRTSAFDPLWYVGSFALGATAAAIGDKVSLGFLQATEEQVEAHLDSHLDRLPAHDIASRKIVEAMKRDEAEHAQSAREMGAQALPFAAQKMMSLVSKIMTTVAAKI
jgi:3-demethoxyubiquinol 3-hydroxylase